MASTLKFLDVQGPYSQRRWRNNVSFEVFFEGPLSCLNLSKALDFPSCAQGEFLMASTLKFLEVHGPYGWPISMSNVSLEVFFDGPLSCLNLSKALDFPSCAQREFLMASTLKFLDVHGPYGWPISMSNVSFEVFFEGPLSCLNLSKALDFPSCAQGEFLMASTLKFLDVQGPYGWPISMS